MAKREVIVELRLEDKNAVQELGRLQIQTKALNAELKALDAIIKENGKATAQQEQRYGELIATIERNRGVIRELKNDVSGLTDAGLRFRDKMAQAFSDAIGPVFGKLSTSLQSAQQELAGALKTFGASSAEFQRAAQSVQQLEASMAELKAAQNDATAALKQFGENSKEFTEANERLKALETTAKGLADEVAGKVEPKFVALNRQLREARRESQAAAEKFGFMSKEFKAAANRADDLEDQMRAVNAAVQGIDAEGKVELFGKALQGVAGAFSLAQGAAALFGKENEAVQEALLKVQAAMAIQQGISGLIEGAKAARALATTLGLVAPAAQAGTVAVRAMSAAAIATGIGAIVVAIGALAAGFISASNAAKETAARTQELIDKEKQLQAAKEEARRGVMSAQLKLQVQMGQVTQQEADREQLKLDLADKLRQQYIEQAKLKQDLAKATEATAKAEEAVRRENEAGAMRGGAGVGRVVNTQQRILDIAKEQEAQARKNLAVSEETVRLTNEEYKASYQISVNDEKAAASAKETKEYTKETAASKKESAAASKEQAKSTKEAAQAEAEFLRLQEQGRANATAQFNEQLQTEEQLLNNYYDSLLTLGQRAENEVNAVFFASFVTLEQQRKDGLISQEEYNARIVELEKAKVAELAKANAEAVKAGASNIPTLNVAGVAQAGTLEEKKAQLMKNFIAQEDALRAQDFANEQQYLQAKAKLYQQYTETKTTLEKQSLDITLQATGQALDVLSSNLKEGSAAQKAVAVAQAIINTYLAANRVLSDPTYVGPTRFIAAASTIAAGLLNVSKIVNTNPKFAEGGFTSKGSKYKPAGVVHAGEWVAPAWQVKHPSFAPMIDWLEEQRRSRGGRVGVPYASGGMVTAPVSVSSTVDLMNIENAVSARLAQDRPLQVDVVEINKAQTRVRVADRLATA